MSRFDDLVDERVALHKSNTAILDQADADKREFTGEEQEQWEKQYARINTIGDQLDTRQKHIDLTERLSESAGRQTEAAAGGPLKPTPKPVGSDMPGQLGGGDGSLLINGHEIRKGQPGYAALAARNTPEYAEVFNHFLMTGETGGIEAVLKTTDDALGGSFTTTKMLGELLRVVDDEVFMRKLARVLPPLTKSTSLGVPTVEARPSDADWTPEIPASDITEDTSIRTGKRELVPHLNTKLIRVGMKLMRVAAIPMDTFIAEEIAYKHATAEENAFLTGHGSDRPLGIFIASADGISTARDVASVGAAPAIHSDDYSEMFMTLKPQYQAKSTWLVHRDFIKKSMQLKDAEGRTIWQPGLVVGMPATILGRPFVQNEFAPSTFTNGSYVAVLGDFKRGYWIVDSLAFSIQRLAETFARTNEWGFLGRKETDGMPVLEEAFVRLKMTT